MTAVNACKLIFLSISTYQLSTAEGATSATQSYPNLALVTSPHCLHRAGGALQKIPSRNPERHSSRARWFSLPPVPFKTIHISPWWTPRSVNTGSTQWKLTSKIGSERGGNRGTRTKPVTPLGSLTSRQGERDAAFLLPGMPPTPRRCPWALPARKEWLRQPLSPKPSGVQHIS